MIQAFTSLPEVREVLASGETKASVIVEGGVQVDLRVVEEDSYGAALQYFTGSKDHNIRLRGIARAKGIKSMSTVCLREKKRSGEGKRRMFMEPSESPGSSPNSGKTAARSRPPRRAPPQAGAGIPGQGRPPCAHQYSDGASTIEDMVKTARNRGYQYIAICDHSKSLKIAHGLDEPRLMKQMEEIDRLNEKLKGFQILKGIEVDILMDGDWTSPIKFWKNSTWSLPRFTAASNRTGEDDPADYPGP